MFDKMRKCLDDFEKTIKKGFVALTREDAREDEDSIKYFYLNFANAMLHECPDVDKVGRVIVVEHGLFDDIEFKFKK